MKVVILAGGLQSTISEITVGIPKPMAEIGGRPILWHIMKNFSARGFHDFVICGGYKVNMMKDYFKDFYAYQSDITIDLAQNTIQIHKKKTEDWNVTVIDTGLNTTPGKRILLAKQYIGEEDFIVVHGDCISDIDYHALLQKHQNANVIATMAVARPTGRSTMLPIEDDDLLMKHEDANLPKNQAWVNACCEVFTKNIFRYLEKNEDLSDGLLMMLAEEKQIITYKHMGFWTPIETNRERATLEDMWSIGHAPWKVWEE